VTLTNQVLQRGMFAHTSFVTKQFSLSLSPSIAILLVLTQLASFFLQSTSSCTNHFSHKPIKQIKRVFFYTDYPTITNTLLHQPASTSTSCHTNKCLHQPTLTPIHRPPGMDGGSCRRQLKILETGWMHLHGVDLVYRRSFPIAVIPSVTRHSGQSDPVAAP